MKTHPIIGYLVNSHARLIEQRDKEEALRQAAELRAAKERTRFANAGLVDVRRSGIHAAYVANEGRRQSKPADVWVACCCGGRMKPGIAHVCDRSAR